MRVLENFKDFDTSVEYRCGKCGKKFYLQRLARQCYMSHSYGTGFERFVSFLIPYLTGLVIGIIAAWSVMR